MPDENGPRDSWPSFLDHLNSDPDRAWREFYDFFMRCMRSGPPRHLRLFRAQDRDDEIEELLSFFCDRSFATLKRYRDKGKPFVGWFYFVANNRLNDRYEKYKKRTAVESAEVPSEMLVGIPPNPSFSPDVLRRFRTAFRRLDPFCRLLLIAAKVEGMEPRKIVLLLRWSKDRNKEVSDKVGSCAKALRRLLAAEGVDERVLRELPAAWETGPGG